MHRGPAHPAHPCQLAYIHLPFCISRIVLPEYGGESALLLFLLPICRPWALAFAIPLFTLVRMMDNSNSAKTALIRIADGCSPVFLRNFKTHPMYEALVSDLRGVNKALRFVFSMVFPPLFRLQTSLFVTITGTFFLFASFFCNKVVPAFVLYRFS